MQMGIVQLNTLSVFLLYICLYIAMCVWKNRVLFIQFTIDIGIWKYYTIVVVQYLRTRKIYF